VRDGSLFAYHGEPVLVLVRVCMQLGIFNTSAQNAYCSSTKGSLRRLPVRPACSVLINPDLINLSAEATRRGLG
jgi:hypothetical protein